MFFITMPLWPEMFFFKLVFGAEDAFFKTDLDFQFDADTLPSVLSHIGSCTLVFPLHHTKLQKSFRGLSI